MRCRGVRKRLIEYLDGGLSENEQGEVGKHIEECERCLELSRKLEKSGDSLSILGDPVQLPEEASGKILRNLRHEFAIKEPPGKLSLIFSSKRSTAIAGAAAVILLLVVVVGGITIGIGSRDWRQSAREVSNLTTMETEKTSAETEILGVTKSGAADKAQTTPPGVTSKPAPQARVTSADYNEKTLKDTVDGMELIDQFSSIYTMSDAINLKKEYTSILAAGFSSQNQDGELLKSMIDFVSSGETAILPCVAERATFEGQNAFIICLVAPTRTGEEVSLSRVEIWVLSPERYTTDPNTSLINWQQFDE